MADAESVVVDNPYFAWLDIIYSLIVRPVALSFWTILYYALYYAIAVTIYIVRIVWAPCRFVFQPVFYVASFVLACIAAPFHFLAKFEVCVFIVSCKLICSFIVAFIRLSRRGSHHWTDRGMALAYIQGLAYRVLHLNKETQPPMRTTKQYRESRRRQKSSIEAPLISPTSDWSSSSGRVNLISGQPSVGVRNRGLLATAIMEEDDSDAV